MKIHRNTYTAKEDGTLRGFSFHSSSSEASKARTNAKAEGRKAVGDIVEVKGGKQGLIDALNQVSNSYFNYLR